MLDEKPPLININIDLKPLAGFGNKLINAVERATGPWIRRREAQADAEAKVVLAKADAEAKEIGFRVSERLSYLEARRQRNIEAITAGALRAWPADISGEPVKEDWVAQFFNLAQDVGDEQMQSLWARLLAGEGSAPRLVFAHDPQRREDPSARGCPAIHTILLLPDHGRPTCLLAIRYRASSQTLE